MHPLLLAGTSFIASLVEAVEAVTIVLAVGYTQGWRAALTGSAWALATLTAIIVILGPALIHFVPLATLQLVIGLFLVLFGFTWLRKAIWRYSGRKALHDEEAIYAREVAELKAAHEKRVGFVTAYNAVLLEGFEIVIIVVTFAAATPGGFLWASIGAIVATLLVVIAGVVLRKPFSQVPENTMKFIVGVMLCSLGTFWSGEGLGVVWAFKDITLVALVGLYVLVSVALIALTKRSLKQAGTTR
ncbi:MAG: TMEM165/GDT1 family protein [Candidatus Eremiobacteraeota bacterium]|nr:TMEM165/GDT1 family protein [Candidatus Eremiobacteraeota bacterium]